MKLNKKIVLIVSSILIFIVVCLIIFFILTKHKSSDTNENSNIIIIKSTRDRKIEKDSLEATEMKIIKNETEITIVATLKNNSDSPINGFFIEFHLLDNSEKVITSFSNNCNQTIEPYSSIECTSYVTGEEFNLKDITHAKIVLLEKY